MDSFLWVLLPAVVAVGSGMLSYLVMQSRMESALAAEREHLASARAQITAQEKAIEDKVRAAEESAQRKAMDQFLQEFRVEERHYVRETRNHYSQKKSMVLQERLFFRNIPLSNWIEHEMKLEEGSDVQQLQQDMSVFMPKGVNPNGAALVPSLVSKQDPQTALAAKHVA